MRENKWPRKNLGKHAPGTASRWRERDTAKGSVAQPYRPPPGSPRIRRWDVLGFVVLFLVLGGYLQASESETIDTGSSNASADPASACENASDAVDKAIEGHREEPFADDRRADASLRNCGARSPLASGVRARRPRRDRYDLDAPRDHRVQRPPRDRCPERRPQATDLHVFERPDGSHEVGAGTGGGSIARAFAGPANTSDVAGSAVRQRGAARSRTRRSRRAPTDPWP